MPDRALCEAPQKLVKPDGSDALDLDAAWSARCRAVPVGRQGRRAADPVRRAGGARGDRRRRRRAGDPVRAVRGAGDLDRRRPAGDLRSADGAAPGAAVRARGRRRSRCGAGRPRTRRCRPPPPEPPIEIPPRPPRSPAPPAAPAPAAGAASRAGGRAAATRAPAAPPTASGARPSHKGEVPALIGGSNGASDVEAAHAALVAITKQDFGTKPKRWASWWKKHQDDDRVEWLFEGLSHKTAEIRAAAEQELRALTGEYFGYAFDLPAREREAARARWQAWWCEQAGASKSGLSDARAEFARRGRPVLDSAPNVRDADQGVPQRQAALPGARRAGRGDRRRGAQGRAHGAARGRRRLRRGPGLLQAGQGEGGRRHRQGEGLDEGEGPPRQRPRTTSSSSVTTSWST